MEEIVVEDNSNWYAIRTNSRAEKKVYQRIVESGVEAYLPLKTSIRIWSDRKKKVTTPLISSFVFVKLPEKNLIDLYNVQGVNSVLKYLNKPAKITQTEIETLKILLSDSDNILPVDGTFYEAGDDVRVIKGAFQGLIAKCHQIKGKHRIIVTIDVVNTSFEVNIPISFVEKHHPSR